MSLKQTTQPSDYEKKRPIFEWHKALILKILRNDPLANSVKGLTDDQIAARLEITLRNDRIQKGEPLEGRRTPTVDNRLRELASESRIVRIKGFDGLKHNFHPDIFLAIPTESLRGFFSVMEISEWRKKAETYFTHNQKIKEHTSPEGA